MAGQVDAALAAGSGGPVLAALARGRIKFARAAYDGPGISAVVNMLESGMLRGEIRPRTDAVFTAMLSNDLYLKIYSQGYGLFDFSQFRPVGECWLYTPKASADPRPTVSFGGALTTAAGSRMVGVIPLAGLGALMMWHHSAQSHAYDEHVVDPGREHQDVHDRVHSTQHDQVHPGTDHWIDHGAGSFTDYPDQHGY
jgi:hypothetical protein